MYFPITFHESKKDVRRQQNLLDAAGNLLGIPPISIFGLFLSTLAFGGLALFLANEIGTPNLLLEKL